MPAGDIAPTGGVQNILSLLGMFKGGTTTQTTSTKPDVTAEGMNALVQQILGSSQGLASVASGQKTAGLYGSTTNQMLLNDLISRTAGELAKAQAGTTTTQTTKVDPKFSGTDVLKGLGIGAAASLLGPTLEGIFGGKDGLLAKGGASLKDLVLGPRTAPITDLAEATQASGQPTDIATGDPTELISDLFTGNTDSEGLGITIEDLFPGRTGIDTAGAVDTAGAGAVDTITQKLEEAGITLEDLSPALTGAVTGIGDQISNLAAELGDTSVLDEPAGIDYSDIDAEIMRLMEELGISFEGMDFNELDLGSFDFSSIFTDLLDRRRPSIEPPPGG